MEAKNADLAGLRINRSTESAGAVPHRRAGRWLAIGVPAAVIVVLVVVLLTGGGAFGSALPVRLTPATMVSPARAGAMLVASGYVVAQRKEIGRASCRERVEASVGGVTVTRHR